MPARNRHRAYIAFRREDDLEEGRRWATWLKSVLEGYRVPARFAGQTNARGERAPDALFPIYRSREERSGDELSETELEALRASDSLIVIASPESARCNHIREEIRVFKELGRADRIVVLMIRGEPHADIASKAEFGITKAQECLAEELRYGKPRKDGTVNWGAPVEPLCADVRIHAEGDSSKMTTGEGYTNPLPVRETFVQRGIPAGKAANLAETHAERLESAKMTIASGLLGFPAPDLIRESQFFRERRLKRGLMAVGALAAALALALGFSYYVKSGPEGKPANGKLFAKHQAELDRAEADAKQLGSQLAEREALLQTTREELDAVRESQAKLERWPVELLADLRDSTADGEKVAQSLAKAAAQAREHFESLPENARKPTDRALLASVLETRAILHQQSGELDESLANLERSLALVEENREAFPGEVPWLAEQSRLRHKIGGIRLGQGKLDGAEQAFNIARELDERLAELEPDEPAWRRNLSAGKQQIAAILKERGQDEESFAAIQPQIADTTPAAPELAQEEVEAPQNDRETAANLAHQANALVEAGDLAGAVANFQQAADIARNLSASEPEVRSDLTIYELRLGALLHRLGNVGPALDHFRAALTLRQEIGVEWAETSLLEDYGLGLTLRAQATAAEQGAAAALPDLQAAAEVRQKLAAAAPDDPERIRAWRQAHDDVAEILDEIGQTEAAQANRRQALAAAQHLVRLTPQAADAHTLLANAHERLADSQSESGESQLAAGNYRAALEIRTKLAAAEPENLESRQKLATGHQNLAERQWKDGDLEAAASTFQALAQLTAELKQLETDNPQWLRLSASTQRSLAQIHNEREDDANAQQAWRLAVAETEKLAGLEPENAAWTQRLRADYKALSEARLARGEIAEARDLLVRAALLSERLGSQPAELLADREQIAALSLKLGDYARARDELAAALQSAQTIGEATPDDIAAQAKIAALAETSGDVLRSLDDAAGAERAYAQCLRIAAATANRAPADNTWWKLAGRCHMKLGDLHQTRSNLPKAKASYEAAIQAYDYLAQRSPNDASWQGDLCASHGQLGEVTRKLGQTDSALRHFQRGLELQQQLLQREPANVLWQSGAANFSYRIGQIHSANRNRREASNWFDLARDRLTEMKANNTLREEDRWILEAISEESRGLGRFRVLGGS